MSVALYSKYRPQTFADVVGQAHAVSILSHALTNHSVGHAYLFSGSRGCGKTSIARIFAKAINCLHPNGFEPCGQCKNCSDILHGDSIDVIEIDGASNNGVENIRSLKENINLAPFSSNYKIYIIDEVHMLSQGAFNALLKTLEEPPEFVVFIMATTEPHKVPVTIRSRCQHIPFHSISTKDIAKRLLFVCQAEGITPDNDAIHEIARQADGALRDGLSLLEQVISGGDVSLANVEALLGAGSRAAFERVVAALRDNPGAAFIELKNIIDGGASPVRAFEELFSLVRDLWLASRWNNIVDALDLSRPEIAFIKSEVQLWKPDTLHFLLHNTLHALNLARQGFRTDTLLGGFMLSLAQKQTTHQDFSQLQVSHQQVHSQDLLPVQISQDLPSPQLEQNNTLLQDILDTVLNDNHHQNNFLLYCALLFSTPAINANSLTLRTYTPYSFDRLRIDNSAADLLEILSAKFSDVNLLYLVYPPFVLPDRNNLRSDNSSDTQQQQDTQQLQQDTQQQDTQQLQKDTQQQDTPTVSSTSKSLIENFRHDLAHWGVGVDVLLSFHDPIDNNIDLEGDY